MSKKRHTVLWMLVAVTMSGFTLSSPVSGASPDIAVYPAGQQHVFLLNASHAFQVLVTIRPKTASLVAIGKSGVVSYEASVNNSGKRFAVRFGRFGKLKMRFDPSAQQAPTTEPQGDCRGRPALVQPGVFRGWFSWRGDRGFSRASARIISGTYIRAFKEVCHGESAGADGDEPNEPVIVARSIRQHGAREIEVYGDPGDMFVTARVVEERPSLQVVRTISAGVRGADVIPSSDAGFKVEPGYPFRGTAILTPGPSGSMAWLGDLEAKFPGRGFLPLVGQSFGVRAAR